MSTTPLPFTNIVQQASDNWKERVWMKAFGTILSVAVLFNGWASYRTGTSVEESAKVRDARLSKLQETSDSTLIQVNSNMLVTLKLLRESTRQLAELTKDPVHIKAAEDADKEVKAHEDAQKAVDKREAKTSEVSPPESIVNENVKDVKKGVGKIQKDVTVIKDEVTKGVKEGVKQGVQEVKKDDPNNKSCSIETINISLAA